MTLQKRRFYRPKAALLPCKRAAFTMQNNRFYNTLKIRLLHNRCSSEKYLQFYHAVFLYI
ncbi:hypothetical protein CLI70_01615 [Prevotella intermedia]|nr:hypothetical protein CLI70_01615 [Prevotella intermedia]PDP83535.1 hypothetical protein CLI69_01340 [Prevotella intermedia]